MDKNGVLVNDFHEILQHGTSLSDTDRYRTACLAAASARGIRLFKKDPSLREIFEHAPADMCRDFLDEALRLSPTILDGVSDVSRLNDAVGSPELVEVPGIGNLSSSTARYVLHAAMLHKLFGSGLGNVVEIGGGYGGLAHVATQLLAPASWTIIDLPEAAKLQRAYLRAVDASELIAPLDYIDVDLSVDTVFSAYALTELKSRIGLAYLALIGDRARQGLVIGNSLSEETLSKSQLESWNDRAIVEDERPSTYPGTYHFYWKAD